ncbi:hypothetical protein J5N97_028412 [Dioscorea zingiberensis]|uniref:Uncharacterized protein n=1 Tax=Dioscorea zingiberensis TaxID=325984 RepID=A0A9D5BYX5_9LILI|nr:hypothetical protein J5N97_028412 [Dioscorea zingiberensis]
MVESPQSAKLFEEILIADPLSFKALFENVVIMDRCGEGEAMIEWLEAALDLVRSGQKEKAARNVRPHKSIKMMLDAWLLVRVCIAKYYEFSRVTWRDGSLVGAHEGLERARVTNGFFELRTK